MVDALINVSFNIVKSSLALKIEKAKSPTIWSDLMHLV